MTTAHLLIELFFAVAGAIGITVLVRDLRRAAVSYVWERDA